MKQENDGRWVRSLLRPAENVLWFGQPENVRLLSKEDFFLIPFSLVWCGFVWFALISCLRSEVPWPVMLFLIPFIIIALYLLPGRFVVLYLQQRNLQYALTSQRLIQKQGKSIKTVELELLPLMNMDLREDGTGTIFFGQRRSIQNNGFINRMQYSQPVFELVRIKDANRVGTLIQNARTQALRSSSQ